MTHATMTAFRRATFTAVGQRDDEARSIGRRPGNSRASENDDRGSDRREDARCPDRERAISGRGFDPRESFTRDLDLPRGPDRELVRHRDRDIALRGSEARTFQSLCCCVALAAAVSAVSPVAYAQSSPTRQLWTTMAVQGGLRGDGFSFDLFGRPQAIDFVVTVVNDSPDTLVFPAAFAANLVVRLQRDDSLVATKTVWQGVDVAVPDEDGIPVGLSASFNVVPQGVVKISGLLQPTMNTTFERGLYAVILNVRKSVATVRDGAGGPWLGHFGEEIRMPVRVIERRTPDEVRRANLAAANAAFLKGDADLAVKHYAEMLRNNSDDFDAQYGIANAYFELDRFKEAVSAFETVILRMPRGERSPVYSQAAFAYVALGNEGRAEAILYGRIRIRKW